jgi:hypothetical protein
VALQEIKKVAREVLEDRMALELMELSMVVVAVVKVLAQVGQYELFGVLVEHSHPQIQVMLKEISWQYLVKT